MNLVFNAVSQMTGGLITDITSMVTGVIVLGFIAMGLDYLKDVLDGAMYRRSSDKWLSAAKVAKDSRDTWATGSAEWDHHNALYRRFIRKSSEHTERGWKP